MPRVPRLIDRAGRLGGDAGGASAVEFALVMPLLLGIVLGICALGLYLGAAHNLRQITAEAARASVAGISDDERASLARQRVASALAGGSMFPPGSVTVQVGPDPTDAMLYTVTLSFDARTLGLSGITSLLPTPGETLRSSATVRRGGL